MLHCRPYLAHHAESDDHCTLAMKEARMGDRVKRVGLYLLSSEAPYAQPLFSQAVPAACTKLVLPITGRQLGNAAMLTGHFLVNLGLCVHHL